MSCNHGGIVGYARNIYRWGLCKGSVDRVKVGLCFFVLSLCLCLRAAQGQNYVGISQSNFAPLEQLHLNPAKLVDSRMKFDINLFSASYFTANNFSTLGSLPSLFSLSSSLQVSKLASEPVPVFSAIRQIRPLLRTIFVDAPQPVTLVAMVEYRGPSFMIELGQDLKRKHSIGFFLRSRAITSLGGVNRNYVNFVFQIADDNNPINTFTNNLRARFPHLSFTTNVYNEIGLAYGSEIFRKGSHILSGGLAVKRYNGVYLSALKANDLFIRFDAPPFIPSDNAHLEADMFYGNSNPETKVNFVNPLAQFDYSQLMGGNGGWGADIGFTYTYIPGAERYYIEDTVNKVSTELRCENKYAIKISASVTDLGYMVYGIPAFYSVKTKNATITNWSTGARRTDFLFLNSFLLRASPTQHKLTVIAPTMARADIDLRVSQEKPLLRDAYVNLAYNHSLSEHIVSPSQVATALYSYFLIAPRFERKDWEVSMPITIFPTARSTPQNPFLHLGLAGRYKYFFAGVPDLGAVLAFPASQASGVYAGVKYGVAYTCPDALLDSLRIQDSIRLVPDSLKDRDHDGVPDVKDKCVDTPGVASNFGCPLNQDSLFENSLLRTPWARLFEYGTGKLLWGKKVFLDTLAKILRDNPRFSVLVSGEADIPRLRKTLSQDSCFSFTVEGTVDDPQNRKKWMDSLAVLRTDTLLAYMRRQGVPDQQMIGIAMRSEQPINVVPPFRQYIPGKDDDRDGILDEIDRCPTVPGIFTEEGCPAVDRTNAQAFSVSLAERVEFWKGLGTFAYSSEANLDEVAAILKRTKRLKCLVRTYVGREIVDRTRRAVLAQQRADTVRAYLVKQGVDSNQIIALGMHPYEPLASVPTVTYVLGSEDTDHDGVADMQDRCPTLHGSAQNGGCPSGHMGNIYLFVDSLASRISFLPNKEQLKLSAGPALVKIINTLRKNPKVNVLVSGIVVSDKLSPAQRNTLANKRALAIRNYLVGFGIDPKRVDAVGMDWQQPPHLVSNIRVLESHLFDSDKDGIKDYEDKCPTISGPLATNGCPQMLYEAEEQLNEIQKKIQFKGNTEILEDGSYQYVDQLVAFLKKHTNINVVVYGNLYKSKLSPQKQDRINEQRARVLRDYLIAKCINPYRVVAVGVSYLEKRPWLVPNVIPVTSVQDFDGDAVKDLYDRCPRTVGSAYNYGCPYDTDKITKEIEGLSQKIYFDVGKYDLLPQSIRALDKITKMLLSDMSLRFVLAGNTDNTGSQTINQPLSLNRAKSVRDYFIKKGIAPDRLLPIGLSDRFPIGDNKTHFGRQVNRSVRFQLLE